MRVAHHYLGLARSHLARAGNLGGEVKLKKLFYLIRPIIALDWMAAHGFRTLPPMNMRQCLDALKLDSRAAADIEHLLELKSRTREMGSGPAPPALARYLEARYGFHEMNGPGRKHDTDWLERSRGLAAAFYRNEIETRATAPSLP